MSKESKFLSRVLRHEPDLICLPFGAMQDREEWLDLAGKRRRILEADPLIYRPRRQAEPEGKLVVCSSHLIPSLASGNQPLRAGRPIERLRLLLVVQRDEVPDRCLQLRARPTARCVLPVPIPPIRTALRCRSSASPEARPRTNTSSTANSSNLLGQRQLRGHHLAFDRPRLLLADLGRQNIAEDPLRIMAALQCRRHDLVVRLHHAGAGSIIGV